MYNGKAFGQATNGLQEQSVMVRPWDGRDWFSRRSMLATILMGTFSFLGTLWAVLWSVRSPMWRDNRATCQKGSKRGGGARQGIRRLCQLTGQGAMAGQDRVVAVKHPGQDIALEAL